MEGTEERHSRIRTVEAIVIDEFGPPTNLHRATIELPAVAPGQLLVRLDAAGIGSWDPFERQGGYAELTGQAPEFPYVLGSEGAGTAVQVASDVDGIAVGDQVYCVGFLDPLTSFYSGATVVTAALSKPIPDHLDVVRAAGLAGAGTTALRGLTDVLSVESGDRIAITGASGALGHVALQIAAALGAEVTAIASGEDGVEFARQLGCHHAFDGHDTQTVEQLDSIDKALLLAPGAPSEHLAQTSDAAHPTGVAICADSSRQFNGEPDEDIVERLDDIVREHLIDVHVHATYRPYEIVAAHRALDEHHLGKLILDTTQLSDPGPTWPDRNAASRRNRRVTQTAT